MWQLPHSLVVVTPVKYEHNLKDITYNLAENPTPGKISWDFLSRCQVVCQNISETMNDKS